MLLPVGYYVRPQWELERLQYQWMQPSLFTQWVSRLVLDACTRTDLQRVLVDHRELQGGAEGVDKTFYSFGIEDRYKNHLRTGGQELKFAYVGATVLSQDPVIRFADDTGFPAKLFNNYDQAIEWLQEEGI